MTTKEFCNLVADEIEKDEGIRPKVVKEKEGYLIECRFGRMTHVRFSRNFKAQKDRRSITEFKVKCRNFPFSFWHEQVKECANLLKQSANK